jgi:pimeloyl-ACP methyl ester carboxylesterase
VSVVKLLGRGRPKPLLDESGRPLRSSISEKAFVDINGVRQGMFIQSKDARHPVLLCLHGGLPEYFLTERYPTGLENDFTVAWWEQRGAGLSYSSDIPPETMTLQQFIADTLSVTSYLRNRFDKEKVHLMAHSGGTFIGLQAAARAPELYYAYIGMAQTVNQLQSERLAYKRASHCLSGLLGRPLADCGGQRLGRLAVGGTLVAACWARPASLPVPRTRTRAVPPP